jgi:hypothetical protein
MLGCVTVSKAEADDCLANPEEATGVGKADDFQ